MNEILKTVTDTTFRETVLCSRKPVLVDFWGQRCAPCRAIARMIEASAQQHAARLSAVSLNVEENPVTPTRYAVRSIPTLMIFKDGQPVATRIGSLSQGELEVFIAAHA